MLSDALNLFHTYFSPRFQHSFEFTFSGLFTLQFSDPHCSHMISSQIISFLLPHFPSSPVIPSFCFVNNVNKHPTHHWASLAPPVLATFCHAALSVSPSARVSRPAQARETMASTIIETMGISLQTSCFCSEQLALGSDWTEVRDPVRRGMLAEDFLARVGWTSCQMSTSASKEASRHRREIDRRNNLCSGAATLRAIASFPAANWSDLQDANASVCSARYLNHRHARTGHRRLGASSQQANGRMTLGSRPRQTLNRKWAAPGVAAWFRSGLDGWTTVQASVLARCPATACAPVSAWLNLAPKRSSCNEGGATQFRSGALYCRPKVSFSTAICRHWVAKHNRTTHNGSTNCCDFAAPKPRFRRQRGKTTILKRVLKGILKENYQCQIQKFAARAPFTRLMLPLQCDLRLSAAKRNSITHAAAARSNLDAAIPLRSADTYYKTQ